MEMSVKKITENVKHGARLSAGKASAEFCSEVVWAMLKARGIQKPNYLPRDLELLLTSFVAQFTLDLIGTHLEVNKERLDRAQHLVSLATIASAKDTTDFLRNNYLGEISSLVNQLTDKATSLISTTDKIEE